MKTDNETPNDSRIRWVVIENSVTVVATITLILGLYAMGAGWWSSFGALLMSNITTIKYR